MHRDAELRGVPRAFVSALLREALAAGEFAVHFVDFEAFSPAIPLYVGTHPYEVIPFQWSDHVLHENAELIHRESLHDGEVDPRREFRVGFLRVF
jgi:hypothetical protein